MKIVPHRSLFLLCCLTVLLGSLHAQKTSIPISKSDTEVPFVGCPSDGQVGTVEAPKGAAKRLLIESSAAKRLAYYRAENGIGALAPRGWHCFGVYGSNGATLYVFPDPMSGSELLSPDWKGFSGPALQVSAISGDTSGRFSVARFIALAFPDHKDFAQNVINEGIEPASSFPLGPYPTDTIKHRSPNIVEFHTPVNSNGLGTESRLIKNEDAIDGAAILSGETPDLIYLSVRLSPASAYLSATIIQQVEREVAGQ